VGFSFIITMKNSTTPRQFKCYTVFFTVFNYGDSAQKWLLLLKDTCDWVLGQVEKCPTTGKLHIQGMAWSKTDIRWGYLKDHHREKCHSPLESIEYCSKEDTRVEGPFEYGTRPTWNVKGQKLKNADLIKGDIKELIDTDRVSLLSVKRILEARTIYANLKPIVPEDKVVKGYWHVGPPRTGKSTAARTGTYYLKAANKWWDGYMGEDKVVLEDVEPSMKEWLGYFLKIWTDWWHFRAEIKGGSIMIQIKEFHITSNYYIHEVFGLGIEAIECRFNVVKYPIEN